MGSALVDHEMNTRTMAPCYHYNPGVGQTAALARKRR